MSVERPINWHPPAKNLGGENIPALYAQFFVDEIVAMIFVKTRNFNLPIAKGINKLTQKNEDIEKRLKKSNLYFYEPNGSVFMDYKIMRNEAYEKIGKEMGEKDPEKASILGYNELKKQFNLNMSTDDALQLARNIVANWDWDQSNS